MNFAPLEGVFSYTSSLMEMSLIFHSVRTSAGFSEVLLRPQTTEEVSQILK